MDDHNVMAVVLHKLGETAITITPEDVEAYLAEIDHCAADHVETGGAITYRLVKRQSADPKLPL